MHKVLVFEAQQNFRTYFVRLNAVKRFANRMCLRDERLCVCVLMVICFENTYH